MIERKQNHWTLILAALCWVVGWAAAVAYGHGFEFQRMVVAIPGVVLAGLFVLPRILKGRGLWMPGLILLGGAGVYFGIRALNSPVWDLGKMDALLVCLGLLSALLGAALAGSKRAIWVFLGGLVVLFLANAGVAVVQATSDPAYAFLRMARVAQNGVSGLFWHRNYLAGFLELVVPVFLGVALVSGCRWQRMGFGLLAIGGLVLAYYSQSRGGFFSVGVGCTVSFAVWLLMGWKEKSKMLRLGLMATGVVTMVVMLGVGWMLVSKVSANRGQSESVDGALTDSGVRLTLAGSAYDQWQERVMVGTGARTFSYLVVKNWVRGRTDYSLGNPEMAHNDYLQTLAEYGLIGFSLAVGVLVLALGRGLNMAWSGEPSNRSLTMALHVGAVGGISGAMVHSCVDFSLHILPNALLFGVLVGFVLCRGRGAASKSALTDPEFRVSRSGGVFGSALLVVAIVGTFVAGRRELLILPKWFAFEQAVIAEGMNGERKKELREIIEQAPDFRLARHFGRVVMLEMVGNKELRECVLPGAIWAMEMAVERHPFDGESRLVYANFLEVGGDEEGAVREYLKGIEATWRREDKYGGLCGFSDHLARRGLENYLARKPERALALFELALGYLEQSWELKYRGDGWGGHAKKKKALEERVKFLRGAGIKAADLTKEFPAPPVK